MRKSVDNNQAEIVEDLRRVGATVQILSDVGQGCPDIVVGFRGRNYLMEIKDGFGRLNKLQAEWHTLWRGQVAVVKTFDEALRVITLEYT